MTNQPEHGTNRRQFLHSTAATVIAMHAAPAFSGSNSAPAGNRPKGEPRLRKLELACAAPLDDMRAFYGDRLGLKILGQGSDYLKVAGGQTEIVFTAAGPEDGEPFYHFAFNIPENKIRAARDWQLARSRLIPAPERLRDADFPDDVIDYSHWNAHSVFYWDPAGSLVEYIARHDLDNAAAGEFGTDDILYASEIAFIVDEVAEFATGLEATFGLDQYRGASDQFHASGDEMGLLLTMGRGRNLGFGEGKPADVFPTAATIRAESAETFRRNGFPYRVDADGE